MLKKSSEFFHKQVKDVHIISAKTGKLYVCLTHCVEVISICQAFNVNVI